VSAERVAVVVECVEFGRPWLSTDVERWSAYPMGEDGEPPAITFFCPRCAEREFRD
jgi:hypothetical protein